MRCVQPRVLEPTEGVSACYGIERRAERRVEGVLRAGRRASETRLGFGPQLFDRSVVRAVRRQPDQSGARPPHGPRRGPMRLRIVPDNHVASMQLGSQHLLDVRVERRGVDGPGQHQRSDHPLRAQGRDHRGERAYALVIAVVTPVSSTKNSRDGLIRRLH